MLTAARRGVVIAAALASTVLVGPQAAWAHSAGGPTDTVGGFVWLGNTHMLTGWNHLLFVGGILLLAGEIRRATKLISLFALGHSITLFTATVADWHVNPALVDMTVALSLVFVGVVGLEGRPKDWTWFAAAVLACGLVHGLGLSARLQAIGLPSDGMIPRILAFNIGVEIGQLIALLGMLMLADVLSHHVPKLRDPRLPHGALVAAGAIAAALLAITSGATISVLRAL